MENRDTDDEEERSEGKCSIAKHDLANLLFSYDFRGEQEGELDILEKESTGGILPCCTSGVHEGPTIFHHITILM